VLSEEF